MQTKIDTENDYVKIITIECTPVELLIIKTGLELLADNPNLNIKDRRIAINMIKHISGKENIDG